MNRLFFAACLILTTAFSAHAQQKAPSTSAPPDDSWGTTPATPVATTPAPADSAATLSATDAGYAPEPRPVAALTPLNPRPKLNPNDPAPYNAKAVKKSRAVAVKTTEKQQRRTFKARDIRERQQDKVVKKMRKGQTGL